MRQPAATALGARSTGTWRPFAAAILLAAIAFAAPAVAGGSDSSPPPPRIEFGHSVEGRELLARRVGPDGGPRTLLVVGEIHGNEEAGRAVIRSLRRHRGRARGLTIWTIATVNPDGHEADARTNARGVDLNRNFPFDWSDAEPPGSLEYGGPRPLSEPESRAFRDLVRRLDPDITVIYHQPWGVVLAPCGGPAPLQKLYARVARMRIDRCRGEGLPGTMTRWTDSRRGVAFVVELAAGRLDVGEVKRHTRAIRALARG